MFVIYKKGKALKRGGSIAPSNHLPYSHVNKMHEKEAWGIIVLVLNMQLNKLIVLFCKFFKYNFTV